MKNSTTKSNFDEKPSDEGGYSDKLQKQTNLSSKAVKSTMTEQLIVPPARVWEKIEKILDEQDERRDTADKIITSSLGHKNDAKPKKLYLATVAGLGLVAGITWLVL